MSETVATLGSALALDRAETERLIGAGARGSGFAGIAQDVLASLLPDIWSEVAARVRLVIDVPIPGILGAGWSRYVDLLKFCDAERYPPDRVSLVPLAAHTVRSRHRPHVEIEVSGVVPVPVTLRLGFQVDVAADVQGAKLAIQGGRIVKLLGGTVGLKAALSCEGERIVERESALTLPGEHSFGEGIPIAPAIPLRDVVIAGVAPAAPPEE
jgi:hypothetical protein